MTVLKAMILGISVWVCGLATAHGSLPATQAVWEHHIEAWESRDLEAISTDYTESSILVVNGRVFRGKTEIKEVFRSLFRIFDNGNNKIDPPVLVDRVVYLTWHFQPTGEQEFFGTDTFVIEDGVITVQTIASPLYDFHPVK